MVQSKYNIKYKLKYARCFNIAVRGSVVNITGDWRFRQFAPVRFAPRHIHFVQ